MFSRHIDAYFFMPMVPISCAITLSPSPEASPSTSIDRVVRGEGWGGREGGRGLEVC